MNRWYVSLENKARGPYSDLEMRDKIQSGDLKPETLAYKEGDADWRSLEEQDIWSESFVPKANVLKAKSAKDWVLLVENPIKAGDFQQQGPFSDEEVRAKVELGEVHLKDYCWRKGMKDWKPLVDLPELVQTRKEKIKFDEPQKPSVYASEFAEPIAPAEVDLVPQGALVEVDSNLPDFIENTKVETVRRMRLVPLLPSVLEKQKYKKEILYFLLAVCSVFLFGLGLGKFQEKNIVRGFDFLGAKLKSIGAFIAAEPVVTYVMLKPSLVDKTLIRVRTDVEPGKFVEVTAYTASGDLVLTKNKARSLSVVVDDFGLAEINTNKFLMKDHKVYTLKARVGKIQAQMKDYRFIKD